MTAIRHSKYVMYFYHVPEHVSFVVYEAYIGKSRDSWRVRRATKIGAFCRHIALYLALLLVNSATMYGQHPDM